MIGTRIIGLRTLRVHLYYCHSWYYDTPLTYVQDMLKPLRRQVRGLEDFSLWTDNPEFDIAALEEEVRGEVFQARTVQEKKGSPISIP